MTEAPRTDGPIPATGTCGVGGGVGVGVSKIPGVGVGVPVSRTDVGVGVPVPVGVGVSVPVGVGVSVAVGVTVPVGVGVLVTWVILKVSVHACVAAAGVDSGTVGATASSSFSFWLVRIVATPRPRVIKEISKRYQFFLINFIRCFYRHLPSLNISASTVICAALGIVNGRVNSLLLLVPVDSWKLAGAPLTRNLPLVALVPTTARTTRSPGRSVDRSVTRLPSL